MKILHAMSSTADAGTERAFEQTVVKHRVISARIIGLSVFVLCHLFSIEALRAEKRDQTCVKLSFGCDPHLAGVYFE